MAHACAASACGIYQCERAASRADLSRGHATATLVSELRRARDAVYGEAASTLIKESAIILIRRSLDDVPWPCLKVLSEDGPIPQQDLVICAAVWLYTRLLQSPPIMKPAFGHPMRRLGALYRAAKLERQARNGLTALHDQISLEDFFRGAVCFISQRRCVST